MNQGKKIISYIAIYNQSNCLFLIYAETLIVCVSDSVCWFS